MIARFSNETKVEIMMRDRDKCVLCGDTYIIQIHHVYYGNEAVNTENKNDSDQGVCLCVKCHTAIHEPQNNDDKIKRIRTKIYLDEKIYENIDLYYVKLLKSRYYKSYK